MEFDDIKQILDLVREHDLAEFEVERDGLKLRVRKAGRELVVAAPAAVAAAPLLPPVAAPAASDARGPVDPEAIDLAVIKSPIVGTFYRSPDPSAPAFVNVGDVIKKGQVLCIIEAMKLMNEIVSDADGEISAVYVENGKAVQFGDRLFALKVGS